MSILKVPELIVPPEKPFEKDELEREEIADNLTILIDNTFTPFVLALDSSWGTGKTTFLRMWEQKLTNQKYNCFIYNAWNNDFVEDPFISFMGEIDKKISMFSEKIEDKETKKKLENAWEQTKNCGRILGKRLVPLAIRMGTAGLVPFEEKDLAALTQTMGGITDDFFKEYQETQKSLVSFKQRLQEFIEFLNPSETARQKPLIIFVDELDRCRPIFAIQLLERIKHLFDIPGIVFVLAMDMEQLGQSLKVVYGNNMNVNGYLRRFFDQEFTLPAPSPEKYPIFLINHYGLEPEFLSKSDKTHFLNNIQALSKSFNLSLRDLERICFHFNIFLRTQDKNWDPQIITFLLMFRISRPIDYKNMVENLSEKPFELSQLKLERIPMNFDEQKCWTRLRFMANLWNLDETSFKARAHESEIDRGKSSPLPDERHDPMLMYLEQRRAIFNFFLDHNRDFQLPLLNYHAQKLEFISNFKLPAILGE